jgi:itaconyl-CoA hydratase
MTNFETYFEDFRIGQMLEHHRGRTVTEYDNTRWTLATMNTAQVHFNRELMPATEAGHATGPIVNGALVLALAVGLTTADICGNSLGDVSLDEVRFRAPTFPGDTLYARSEIVALDGDPEHPDAGVVTYRIDCTNQHDTVVAQALRQVRVKKAAAWRDRDSAHRTSVYPDL